MRQPVAVLLPRRNHHAFRFQIALQRFGPMLASDTAHLCPAEWHFVVADVQRVDPHVAGLQVLRRVARFRQVARKDTRASPKSNRSACGAVSTASPQAGFRISVSHPTTRLPTHAD